MKHSVIVSYDIERYPFQKIIAAKIFRVSDISRLHVYWSKKMGRETLTYGDNLRLRKLMQDLPDDALFYKIYHKWMAEVIAPLYGSKVVYSAHPKMRVHLAKTGSVSSFHRDANVTKRDDQINCYLPFTDVFQSNTVWCEQDYGQDNFEPIELKYGEAILWDGGFLSHGTYDNETEFTRVSCDFRFHPKAPERVRQPWSDILLGRPSDLTPLRKEEQLGRY